MIGLAAANVSLNSALSVLLSSRSSKLLVSCTGHKPPYFRQNLLDVLFFFCFSVSCTFRSTTWAAPVRFAIFCYICPRTTHSCCPLPRLAFPLLSAHGCRVTVHHGFLRAFLFFVTHNLVRLNTWTSCRLSCSPTWSAITSTR